MNASTTIVSTRIRVRDLIAQSEFFRTRGEIDRAAELIEDALEAARDTPADTWLNTAWDAEIA